MIDDETTGTIDETIDDEMIPMRRMEAIMPHTADTRPTEECRMEARAGMALAAMIAAHMIAIVMTIDAARRRRVEDRPDERTSAST